MTEAKQPEALRLADQLRALSFGGTCILAAAELRRQHARIADLEAQLSAIGAGGVEPPRPPPGSTQAGGAGAMPNMRRTGPHRDAGSGQL